MPPRPESVGAWWLVFWPILSFILGSVIIVHEEFGDADVKPLLVGVGMAACGWGVDAVVRWIGQARAGPEK